VLATALADPLVRTYRYRAFRQWDDDGSPPTCRRGHPLPPVRYGVRDCRCGMGHFSSNCACGDVQHIPELGPGCGPVPFDPEAGRHYR
jgi:hypothetical protein